MKGKTWYYREGSKFAELWTILHLPYTFMAISFLVVGFGIQKPINWEVLVATVTTYFLGLGVAAHALDQLPGMGSRYVKHLGDRELVVISLVSLVATLIIGVYYMLELEAWHLLWLIPLQTFFAITYPMAKLFRGFFHNDFWFSVSFGFLPVVIGYYINTLTFSSETFPYALLCALMSGMEITISRHSRKMRKEVRGGKLWLDDLYPVMIPNPEYAYRMLVKKPERALKLLCVTSYTLAVVMLL